MLKFKVVLVFVILSAATAAASDATPIPVIPDAVQKQFEHARADEHETAEKLDKIQSLARFVPNDAVMAAAVKGAKADHDADYSRLTAAYMETQKACGDGYDVQRPQRDGDLVCVAKVK